jgi:hypothetical protein
MCVAELTSMVIKAACGGAGGWRASCSYLPAGRSRLLRAACRPCSRGPAGRALVVLAHRRCRAANAVCSTGIEIVAVLGGHPLLLVRG